MDAEVVDKLAEEVFEYCCANRGDNVDKKTGAAGEPRKVCCKFNDDPVTGEKGLFDEAKNFYRNIAKWHLGKAGNASVNLSVAVGTETNTLV